jgi:hypothetical protein
MPSTNTNLDIIAKAQPIGHIDRIDVEERRWAKVAGANVFTWPA